jgi:hypothetical protein
VSRSSAMRRVSDALSGMRTSASLTAIARMLA